MTHQHLIIDDDLHFVISPDDRSITHKSNGTVKMAQNDHNAERLTFEIPRFNDNHDMSLSNRIEVHYQNTNKGQSNFSSGVYTVDDIQLSEDEQTVLFSWLVSQNATKYAGTVSFMVRFICSENGEVVYVWNTSACNAIQVTASLDSSGATIEEFADLIQMLRDGINGRLIDSIQITESKEEGGVNIVKILLKDGTQYTFNVKNGSKGEKGERGIDGTTPPVYVLAGQINSNKNGVCTVNVYKDGVLCEETLYLYSQVKSGESDWREHGTSTGNIKGTKTWTFGGNDGGMSWLCNLYTDSTKTTLLASCSMTAGATGVQGVEGKEGVSVQSVVKTGTSGLVDTYTITLSNSNTSTFTVTNGKDGVDGEKGNDGISIVSARIVSV